MGVIFRENETINMPLKPSLRERSIYQSFLFLSVLALDSVFSSQLFHPSPIITTELPQPDVK